MRGAHRGQALRREREGLVPGDLPPLASVATQRPAQAIGIGFQVEDGVALRADVAAAEGVVGVAADRHHRLALELQLQPADRLAQRTGAEARMAHQASARKAGRRSR
jgi:hypothetical protein